MRITCPNCTAHFEIPADLLGRKGRSLKCATCGHSWYQTPHVETIDLAEIMGVEYAARARAEMGIPPRADGRQQQAGASGLWPQAAPPLQGGAPPVGVSMLSRRPGMAPAPPTGPPSSYQPEPPKRMAPAPGSIPGAPAWYQPEPAKQPPVGGAVPEQPSWYQPGSGAPRPAGRPGDPPSWYQPDPATQRPVAGAAPSSRPPEPGKPHLVGPGAAGHQGERPPAFNVPATGGAPAAVSPAAGVPGGQPNWYQPDPAKSRPVGPGTVGYQGERPPTFSVPATGGAPNPVAAAALAGQTLRGQAGAGAVGDVSISWTQQMPIPPGAAPPGVAMQPGAAPAAPGAVPLAGGTLMGQAGAAAVGDASVSWMRQARLPPTVQAGQMAPGQTMMGQAGAAAVGDASVSWMQQARIPPTLQAGQMGPGQTMMGQAGAAAVGDASVSWMQQARIPPTVQAGQMGPGQSMMGQAGAGAVGDRAVSWLQPGAPGAGMPGQSMMMPGPQGPGGVAISQMGGAIAGPGQAARSILDGTIHAAAQPGQSMTMPAPQGPGAGTMSQMGAGIAAPGDIARSLLDGSVHAGQPGQSMMQPAGSGAPGTSMLAAAPGVGAPGTSIKQEPQAPGAVGLSQLQPAAAGGQPGVSLKADEAKVAAGETAPTKADAVAVGSSEASKTAKAEAGESVLWSGADEDEELVDPDADRPDFGTAEPENEEEGAAAGEKVAAAAPVVKRRRQPVDPAYITAVLMLLTVSAVGILLYMERGPFAKMWPGFHEIYKNVGLAAKDPGEGLRLARSGMRLQRIGGVETLVVKGYVSNIGNQARNVPGLRLELLDDKSQIVQQEDSAPPVAILKPGDSVNYEIRLPLPNMSLAKKVMVTWVG